jgi:glycosyltransferase involved in cell wall biosynthesis
MGRLAPQKGFDLLIRAFASIAGQFKDWRVVILGDGPDRYQLAGLARSLWVERQVTFAGYQSDPLAWLRHASLFVLSSRYEGFPNALLEAMQCGLPVIAFDCASGPSEIVRHGTDGLLVPPEDVPALAEAMSRMAGNEELRRSLAQRATEVADRFPPGKIYASWLALCVRSAREPARA